MKEIMTAQEKETAAFVRAEEDKAKIAAAGACTPGKGAAGTQAPGEAGGKMAGPAAGEAALAGLAKRDDEEKVLFTREMKDSYTILIPMMAPIHFALVRNVFANEGYNVVLLTNNGPGVVEEGLKYVHNDTCYPALLSIGQLLDALNSGRYDVNRTALMMSQTGGGCRASNYLFLLRRALKKAGYSQVPVISINLSGLEKDSGFKITPSMLYKALCAVVYGDALMCLSNQTKAHELESGQTQALVEDWVRRLSGAFNAGRGFGLTAMRRIFRKMAREFAAIPCDWKPKVKVGVVGEIYVKYSSLGNNNLEDFLAEQDCEVVVPGLLDFVLYCAEGPKTSYRLYGGGAKAWAAGKVYGGFSQLVQYLQKLMIDSVSAYSQFTPPSSYTHTLASAQEIISDGCVMGEGWLLTGEMVQLMKEDCPNIVCTQPFGCLPNHICGKGMIRKIRQLDQRANIVPIDYDPSATRVNQENRIKLMLAVAKENLVREQEPLKPGDGGPGGDAAFKSLQVPAPDEETTVAAASGRTAAGSNAAAVVTAAAGKVAGAAAATAAAATAAGRAVATAAAAKTERCHEPSPAAESNALSS